MTEYLPWIPVVIAVLVIIWVAWKSDAVADAIEKTYEDDRGNDR